MTGRECAACGSVVRPLREILTQWDDTEAPVLRWVCRNATACQQTKRRVAVGGRGRRKVVS